jgi:hypothetical protein
MLSLAAMANMYSFYYVYTLVDWTCYLKKKFDTSVKAVDDNNMSKRILEKFHC